MIGKSNITVENKKLSKIALGSHQFNRMELEKSYAVLDTYYNGGGNVIDSGRCYGLSEQTIGKWINSRGLRDEIVVITKGCNPDFSNDEPKMRINSNDLKNDLTESLENLDTDYIDIYFLHKDDPSVPVGEIMEMLSEYTNKGLVRHLGASNWSTERIEEANRYATDHGLKEFEFSELSFSLKHKATSPWGEKELVREMEYQDYNWYSQNTVPVFGYASQAGGFFYKDLSGDASDINQTIYMRLKEIEQKYGISSMQALFGCYFSCDILNIPLVAASSVEHMQEIVDNCDITLDKNDVYYLFEKRLNLVK